MSKAVRRNGFLFQFVLFVVLLGGLGIVAAFADRRTLETYLVLVYPLGFALIFVKFVDFLVWLERKERSRFETGSGSAQGGYDVSTAGYVPAVGGDGGAAACGDGGSASCGH